MERAVSNFSGIGNTDSKELKVVEIVAAVAIKERTNVMTDNLKYSNKKNLSNNLDKGMEL